MKRFRVQDPLSLALALALSFAGLVFSIDAGFVRSIQAGKGIIPSEFTSQVVFFPIALAVGFACSRVSPAALQKRAPILWWGCVVLLFAALVPPTRHAMSGAERWVKIGPVQFQPAEFAKLCAILYLASVFAKRPAWPKRIPRSKSFPLWLDSVGVPKAKRLLPALFVMVGVALILREPDMGTALVVVAAGFAIAALGGATRKTLTVALSVLVVGSLALCVAQPYRWQRIANHMQRWETQNIDDTGYQTVLSEIAMASGGSYGVGMGSGHVKRLMPATTTDFVMATVGEETGFFGVLTLLALLGALVVRILLRASKMKDRFVMLTLTGIGAWLGFQGCVNLLQANGTLPPIGIPYPFVSSGGSSLIALWAALGLCEALTAPRPAPSHAVIETKEAHAADSDRRRNGRARLSGA